MKQLKLLFIIALLASNRLTAENGNHLPEIKAVRSVEPITIDGNLIEPVWQRAGYEHLIQRDPVEGAEATEKTSVFIAYNDEGLYVAGRCHHSGEVSIAGGLARRDREVESDWFWFWLDPNCDRQSGFGFAVNPDGSIIDEKVYQDIYEEIDWDGVWKAAAQKKEDFWTFEMFIPFSQLRFDKKEDYKWGVNFKRYILANAEHDYFSMVPKTENGFVSRFGHLTGLKGIEPPARLFVSPYVMGKMNAFPGIKDSPFHKELKYGKNIGLDLKYGITGNLTMDLAVNPDFAQAEVDPAQINLSAFETYYSEKRAFFLEGSDIFYFGSNPAGGVWGCYWSQPTIFYSRRIGRQPQGSPSYNGFVNAPEWTTILGAAKVSGKIGKWSVGSVNAVTQKEYAEVDTSGVRFNEVIEPLTYYGVFRGLREFNDGDQGLGFMVTGVLRDRESSLADINNDAAIVTGLDGWTFFGRERAWAFMGQMAFSQVKGTQERISLLQQSSAHYYQRPDYKSVSLDTIRTSLSGFMGRFGLKKITGNVLFQTALGIISPGFNANDLGYFRYGNVINWHIVGGYRWLETTSWYRQFIWSVMTSRNFDFDGNRTFSQYYSTLYILFKNYWYITTNGQFTPDGLDLFITRGGPMMGYPAYFYGYFAAGTDERKNIQFEMDVSYQTIKDGAYYYNTGLYCRIKPLPSIKVSLSANYMWSQDHQQWVSNVADAAAQYGYHYVFSDIKQERAYATFRVDWGITQRLSLQLYTQPYLGVGDYSGFKELAEAETYNYLPFQFNDFNPDFNFKSFKTNLVLRWEYLPGSLLFLVWTHDRANYDDPGNFDLNRDLKSLFRTEANNIYFVKLSYMIDVL